MSQENMFYRLSDISKRNRCDVVIPVPPGEPIQAPMMKLVLILDIASRLRKIKLFANLIQLDREFFSPSRVFK
jgi:hypothetical protein